MIGNSPGGKFNQTLRHFYGVIFASLTLWVGCASSPSHTTPVACASSHPPKTDLPTRGISAHRGGLFGCPVNTVGAFQRAICTGVHQIELDVRMTVDGELVVVHDDRVTDDHGRTLRISESTLAQIRSLQFKPCEGENKRQSIPTLAEALAVMPQNIWINVDIKDNNPLVGRQVAEAVAKADRFSQVIFGARDETDLAIRRVAEEAGKESWVANMSRHIFRCLYVDSTISSCDEFIQLFWLLGRPSSKTMARLKQAGVRVNYSWLWEEDENELRQALADLFHRGVDFVLVDYAAQAMEAACALGLSPVMRRWDGDPPFTCAGPPSCAPQR